MKPSMRELLPKLRKIGFGTWDPLGLADACADRQPMADEYDNYLQVAFGIAANGGGIAAVREALRAAEVRMGLGDGATAAQREQAASEILVLACCACSN
jgi:hypothetical protein